MIAQYLDLSTSFLAQHEAQRMAGCEGIICHEYAEGWWVWVPENGEWGFPLETAAALPHLMVVMRLAAGLGCRWINFDADGDVKQPLPTLCPLPTFTW